MSGADNEQKLNEAEKLREEVRKFASKMEDRLLSKLDEGWHGWDDIDKEGRGGYMKTKMVHRLINNCHDAVRKLEKRKYDKETEQDLIDTANLAMFLSRYCKEE